MPDVNDSTSVLRLAANGWVPNNPHLPVLIYRRVFTPDENGVETAQQRQQLMQIGVDYAQGYHFSRPREINDLLADFSGHPSKASLAS